MEIKELIKKNRSYRRFFQNERINENQLKNWVDNARLGASGRNAQSMKYKIIFREDECLKVFKTCKWAGYLSDWDGPIDGEQASAYIIVCNDEEISKNYFCDDGIAIQNILLSAVESGFGGCVVKAFDVKKIKELFNLTDNIHPIEIIALGKPKEQVVICEMENNKIEYYRDENQIHYVPKRKLEDIII
ncbi:MAG: nitroreductase family protein [Marinifilaceae bacterium]|jgi:nitroreductase|nr:nitroreductase family protein [Marinifilaceae bacterium]